LLKIPQKFKDSLLQRQEDVAFTLIEIILVVLILAIIAGLTVPNFNPAYKKIQLQQTSDDLAYLMRYAQSRAVTKNHPVCLEFDSDLRKYWLAEEVSRESGEETAESFRRFPGRLGRTFSIPESVEVESEASTIQFYADGRIDKQHLFVCLESLCYTLSTKEQRGQIRIFDFRLE